MPRDSDRGVACCCAFLSRGAAAQGQRAVLLRTDRAMADSSWSAGFRATLDGGRAPGCGPVVARCARGAGDSPRSSRLLESETLKATWQPIGAELSSRFHHGRDLGRHRRASERYAAVRSSGAISRPGSANRVGSRWRLVGDDVHRPHRRWLGTRRYRPAGGIAAAQGVGQDRAIRGRRSRLRAPGG